MSWNCDRTMASEKTRIFESLLSINRGFEGKSAKARNYLYLKNVCFHLCWGILGCTMACCAIYLFRILFWASSFWIGLRHSVSSITSSERSFFQVEMIANGTAHFFIFVLSKPYLVLRAYFPSLILHLQQKPISKYHDDFPAGEKRKCKWRLWNRSPDLNPWC